MKLQKLITELNKQLYDDACENWGQKASVGYYCDYGDIYVGYCVTTGKFEVEINHYENNHKSHNLEKFIAENVSLDMDKVVEDCKESVLNDTEKAFGSEANYWIWKNGRRIYH